LTTGTRAKLFHGPIKFKKSLFSSCQKGQQRMFSFCEFGHGDSAVGFYTQM
jgi:hypothetical protein